MRRSAVNQRLFMKKLSRDSLSDDEFNANDPIHTSTDTAIEQNNYDLEYNEWPPKVEKHPEFCWTPQILHSRSDWILSVPPMPPDLTFTEMLARAKLPIYIDRNYLFRLSAVYNLPDDKSPIMKINLQELQNNLSDLRNQIGKVTISKLPEPQKTTDLHRTSASAGHWDDLCKEMKEFQDLVLDEHREKKRKYKNLINSCQKYVESKLLSVSTNSLDQKRAVALGKQVCSLIEVFWNKIERIAWESIKSELSSQLIEQKRKRLDKFVQDAMQFAITDRNAVSNTDTSGNSNGDVASEKEIEEGGEDESVYSEEDNAVESDKESTCSDEFNLRNKKFRKQQENDVILDQDMDTDSENERDDELNDLRNEAEMDLNELIQKYRMNSSLQISPKSESNSLGDDKSTNDFNEGNENDDFNLKDDKFRKQQEKDALLDQDMDTDSENEREDELNDLQNEAEMDIDQLMKKYQVHSIREKRFRSDSLIKSKSYSTDTNASNRSLDSVAGDGDLVPVPHLIRATLRNYQHQGLTWLAKLHEKGTNGILADEMGLGKTLQTISLLAHLACHLGNWGPHLIIVPNSLLINWEMEFKKFCPGFKVLVYYGSAAERAKKRVGWNKPYVFNVCIASYATVVQDAHILKRKNWEYMVLDEAQNIKNFESKRWSTLLTFNSEHRILLTGTPLQNSIQELWSLMHFILPDVFSSHSEFKEWFGDPITAAIEAEQIAGSVDPSGKPNELVTKLHCVLRPYLLRRLKKDVEKQMPSKYEHVIKCVLTRRQRTLYDEFMSCASTSDTLKSGSYHGMLNVMMQLRKICNHPDQLNPRMVESPLNFGASCVSSTNIPNILNINCRLYNSPYRCLFYSNNYLWYSFMRVDGFKGLNCDKSLHGLKEWELGALEFGNCVAGYTSCKPISSSYDKIWCKLPSYCHAFTKCHQSGTLIENQSIELFDENGSFGPDLPGEIEKLISLERYLRESVFNKPVGACNLLDMRLVNLASECIDACSKFLFRCNYKAVVDTDRPTIPHFSGPGGISRRYSIVCKMERDLQLLKSMPNNLEFLNRLQSLILPPKSALHDDCGKFHILGNLLERLKKDNHRCLLYTQFSKMLDILENWICNRGYIYVRLDGKTKVDQRQRIVTRFNENPKIFLFISSTRAGGIGLNLTGADTVIFYDTDWNPAMDRQAMDRCHRIGQTKDVNVYRLVCEYTVEENIWRKQLIKRKLDDVVVDQGKFGGEVWFNNASTLKDMITTNKSMGDDEELYGKRVLHESELPPEAPARALKLMAQVEDIDDVANVAMKDEVKDEFKEQFAADTFTSIPALVTLCVKFLKRYNTPHLSHLISEFQIKIDAEAIM